LESTILDSPFPVKSHSICGTLIQLLDLKNVGLAVGFRLCLEAEIQVFSVWMQNYLVSTSGLVQIIITLFLGIPGISNIGLPFYLVNKSI